MMLIDWPRTDDERFEGGGGPIVTVTVACRDLAPGPPKRWYLRRSPVGCPKSRTSPIPGVMLMRVVAPVTFHSRMDWPPCGCYPA